MATIHMETEKVQAVAKLLDTDGFLILSGISRMRSAASTLHFVWAGGNSDDFNNELNRLIKNLENQALQLQNLSVQVSREVDEWIAVDSERPLGRWHNMVTVPEIFSGLRDTYGTANFMVGSAVLLAHIKDGEKAGEIISAGPNWARDAANVSSQLRRVGAEGFARNLGKNSKADWISGALDFTDKGMEDWARYQDGSDRAAALAYDGAFVTAKTLLKPAVQNWVMATVGVAALGTLATAGAPAVLIVGTGLAIWWGSGTLFELGADRLYEGANDLGIKDGVVHGAGDLIDQAAISLSETAQAEAQVIDTGFKNVIKGISSRFE